METKQVDMGKVASVAEQRSDKPITDQGDAYLAGIKGEKPALPAPVASALSPDRIIAKQSKADAKKGKAEVSYESIGKQMAKAYLVAIGEGSKSWQEYVVNLCRTANDAQQERAMKSATEVAEAEDDVTARDSLKKRISEARRIFKALRDDYAGILAVMQGKGSWHSKVAAMPKRTKAGRPAGTTGGTQDQTETTAAPGTKAGHEKVKALPVGQVIQQVEQLSFGDLLKVLDVIAFRLQSAPKKSHALLQSLGQQVMRLRDQQDQAQIKQEAASISTIAA